MTKVGRRTALRLGGSSVVAALAGCVGSDSEGQTTDAKNSDGTPTNGAGTGVTAWEHDTGGGVDEVANGLVFFRERLTEPGEGGDLVALDAESGDEEWALELAVPEYNSYTAPAVDDSVYVGFGDDAIGGGNGELYGLGFDGSVEWTQNTGSIYSRPRVVDGTVYAASDDMRLYAFDRDGTGRWRTDRLAEAPDHPRFVGIEDRIYANAEGKLVAVSPGDGAVEWEYDGVDGEKDVRPGPVVDGVVYLESADALVAVEDGTEQWQVPLYDGQGIPGVSAGNVLVRDDGIRALDRETGDEQWHAEDRSFGGFVPTAVHERSLYLADDTVYAYDAVDGTQKWSAESIDDVSSVVVSPRGDGDVYAHQENRLFRFTPDGELSNEWALHGTIRGYVVHDDAIYVGTTEQVVAIEH